MWLCFDVQAEQKQREELRKMVERRSAQERSKSQMEERMKSADGRKSVEGGEKSDAEDGEVLKAVAPAAAAAVAVGSERESTPRNEAGGVMLSYTCTCTVFML